MERIKKAIENAKSTVPCAEGGHDLSHSGSQKIRKRRTTKDPAQLKDTIKTVIAFVMILFAGWLWLRLDFMNELELIASEYINAGVKQARAEAQKRLADEEKFRQLIFDNLTHCQAAAENNKNGLVKLVKDSVRVPSEKTVKDKNQEFIILSAAEKKAVTMLAIAKAECQQVYDAQLHNGR